MDKVTLVFSKEDVAKCLTPKDAIEMVEYVFSEWGKGNIVMPAKITLDMAKSGYESWSNAMPAFIVSSKIAGIKWGGGYPMNVERGLPFIAGVIILTDPETGQTLAVMDGAIITKMRTGASAAVSARYLAKRDVKNIAIVGAGEQGRSSVVCLHQIYPSAQIRIADISEAKRKTFKKEMSQQLNREIVEAKSVENALQGADLIVLVTTAKSPFVREEWISKGATVLAMGSYQQIDDAFALSTDKIIVDSWPQAMHRGELKELVEAGNITKASLYAEIGDIVAQKKVGRETEQERILMIPGGLGAHDVYIAQQVYLRAKKNNLGAFVEL